MKYEGSTHEEISKELDIPKGTVEDWFRDRGKLSDTYKKFTTRTNKERTKDIFSKYRDISRVLC